MVHSNSIESYYRLLESGQLKKKADQIHYLLKVYGPCTAMELRKHIPKSYIDSNIRHKLHYLREEGRAEATKHRRICEASGFPASEWTAIEREKFKRDKPMREKCKTCKGKGYVETVQGRLF